VQANGPGVLDNRPIVVLQSLGLAAIPERSGSGAGSGDEAERE